MCPSLKLLLAPLFSVFMTLAQSGNPQLHGSEEPGSAARFIADSSWQVTCSSGLGSSIRSAVEWRDPAFFKEDSLFQFFRTFAHYPEQAEITIILSSDRELVARLTDPAPIEFDAHEGPPPFEPPLLRAPIAFFYKVGRNASVQTSTPGQKVITKTLSGSDPLAISEAGLDIYYVGQTFPISAPVGWRVGNCDHSRREVVFVVPGIEKASREQIIAVVRRCSVIYAFHFGVLELRIYRSFDEVARHSGFLSLLAIEGGANRKKTTVRPAVEYRTPNGHLTIGAGPSEILH